MKFPRTLLASALTAGFALTASLSMAKPPTTTPMPPASSPIETPTTHGDTVREAAQRDAAGKPIAPPGTTVRETAHLQGDFMQFDGDKSGSLSRTELNADADLMARFDVLDADDNGEISRIEFNESVNLVSTDPDGDDEEIEEDE